MGAKLLRFLRLATSIQQEVTTAAQVVGDPASRLARCGRTGQAFPRPPAGVTGARPVRALSVALKDVASNPVRSSRTTLVVVVHGTEPLAYVLTTLFLR